MLSNESALMTHRPNIDAKDCLALKSILTLFLLSVAAFLPNLSAIWTSDDYALVYGIFGNWAPSFTEALSRSHQGVITPHRLLTYWLIGTGGYWGPATAHALALVIHFLCAWLFAGLVWRLFGSPMMAFLAAAWFVTAPWITQPVLWWTSVEVIVSTICMLMAAHFFLNSFSKKTAARLWWIVMAWFAAFTALCFYDLWIAGFLLFVGIGLLSLPTADESALAADWRRRIIHIAAMAIPFVLWFGLVGIIGPRDGQHERLVFSLERLPIVLASIHLRVANWLIGPHWLALWRMGLEGLAHPLSAFAFVLGFAFQVSMFVGFAVKPNQRMTAAAAIGISHPLANNQQQQDLSADRFPLCALFCAWMIFLASRVAIVLLGGVSLASRLNYGAGMAVALAAAVLARWAFNRWCKRSALLRSLAVTATVASIALMTLGTVGRARHMALSSQAEAYTIAILDRELSKHPEIHTVTVIGTPVSDIGELGYFSEDNAPWLDNASWLQHVLQHVGHDVLVRVTRSNDVRGNLVSEVYFRWSGDWPEARLERVIP
jgi:hypothetical protein